MSTPILLLPLTPTSTVLRCLIDWPPPAWGGFGSTSGGRASKKLVLGKRARGTSSTWHASSIRHARVGSVCWRCSGGRQRGRMAEREQTSPRLTAAAMQMRLGGSRDTSQDGSALGRCGTSRTSASSGPALRGSTRHCFDKHSSRSDQVIRPHSWSPGGLRTTTPTGWPRCTPRGRRDRSTYLLPTRISGPRMLHRRLLTAVISGRSDIPWLYGL